MTFRGMISRPAALIALLLLATPAFAQYQTPAVDGTVSPGEYANSSGNYSMTWNATYLYVGVQNIANASDDVAIYLDIDPLSTPGGGTNANGNLSGYPDDAITVNLPFRADTRILATNAAGEIRLRDGSGGWGTANASGTDILVVSGSGQRELRIRWGALPGLGAPPASFTWLGFLLGGAILDPMPGPSQNYFFNVTSTADGALTNPFSVQQSTWRVTSSDDTGANTLRDAITNANADTTSNRRYITFGLTGSTLIQTASSFPFIEHTMTIDGNSQDGGTTPAVTLQGSGPGASNHGIDTAFVSNCVVRGLIVQNFAFGIRVTGGTSNLVTGNYAFGNGTGISIAGTPGTNPGTVDNNVIGNNTLGVAMATSGGALYNNKIGVAADGTTPMLNAQGVGFNGANHVIGSESAPNIIANSTNFAIDGTNNGGLLIRGNSMIANAGAIRIVNIEQSPPAVTSAHVTDGSLTIDTTLTPASGTLGVRLDLYQPDESLGAAPEGRIWRATSPCFTGDALPSQSWSVGGGYALGDPGILIATAYSDASCATVGAGSSEFSSTFAMSGNKTWLGGNFSDPANWSDNTLPVAGENFVVKGGMVDVNTGIEYGDVILGSLYNGAAIFFNDGSSLHVNDLTSPNAGSSIQMAGGGTLRVDGTLGVIVNGGTGTVEFGGTSQTLPPYAYNNVAILGSVTNATGTAIVNGAFNVLSPGTFAPSGGTVEMHSGSIGGSGAITFHTLTVPVGYSTTASVGFDVNTAMTIDGAFTPTGNIVIGGSGSLTGSGTVKVSANFSPGFGNQYALNKPASSLTVDFVTGSQWIDGRTYAGLALTNPSGATLAGAVTVTGTLALNAGKLTTAGQSFSVANGAPSAVTAITGWIDGALVRQIGMGTGAYLFPMGTASAAAPATVTLHDVISPGTAQMWATQGEHASIATSGLSSTRDANVYWALEIVSAQFATFDVALTFGSNIDAGASPTAFALRRYDGSWFDAAGVPSSTSISATGLTGTGQFVAGNQLIDHYVVTADTTQYATAPFTTTVAAQDLLNITANDSSTVVTMSSSTGNVLFDSNGPLTNGVRTITTTDNVVETVTLTATDANGKTGTSSAITIHPFNPPTNLLATASSTTQVALSWTATAGATSYEIWRNNALLTTVAATSYDDTAVSPNTSYVYKVKGVRNGATTGFSNVDATTTIVFSDPVLNNTVKVKAVHLTQLRTAVNAMRAAAGLSAATFTDPTITAQSTIVKAVHITQLRTALDQARTALGLPALTYTNPLTIIKAAHFLELRAGVL